MLKLISFVIFILSFSYGHSQLTRDFDALEQSISSNTVLEFTNSFERIFQLELSPKTESVGLLDLFLESQLSNYANNRKNLHFLADSILILKGFKKLAYRYVPLIVEEELRLEDKNQEDLIHFLFEEGKLHHQVGLREKGALQLEKALRLLEKSASTNVEQKVEILYQLQFMYLFSEKSDQVLPTLKEAEYLVGQSNFESNYLKKLVYTELSKYYGNLGAFDISESYLVKSWSNLKKQDSVDSSPLYPVYLYDFMNFYSKAGLVDKAMLLIKETDSYLAKLNHIPNKRREELAAVYNLYGELFVVSDPLRAVPYYDKALEINGNGKPGFVSQYLFNKCKALLYADKPEEAKVLSYELLDVAKKGTDNKLAFMYAMSGNIHIKLKNSEKAISAFDQMVNTISQSTVRISLLDDDLEAYEASFYLHAVKGMYIMMAERLKNEFPENTSVQKAVFNLYHISLKQLYNSIDNQKISEDVRTVFLKVQKGLLDNYLEGLTPELPLIDMIQCSEKINAGFLWRSFKSNHAAAFLADSDLQTKEEELNEQITSLQHFTNSESKKKILNLQLEVEKIRYERKLRYPKLREFEYFDFDLLSFQEQLDEGEMVLKYELVDDRVWLYKITRSEVEILPISEFNSLSEQIRQLYDLLSSPTSDIETIRLLKTELTKDILPIALEGFTRLLIVPEPKFVGLPFEVLGDSNYLIEDYSIRYASALSLLDLKESEVPIRMVGLFAPSYKNVITEVHKLAMRDQDYSLQGAIEEVTTISATVNGEKHQGVDATKSVFKANATDYDILHLAMHSKLNSENSELHSLIFSDNEEDHELFLIELHAMKLKADLAVLSACNTGFLSQGQGTGIASLNTAFTFAGVPSVVASLWSVPDQATKDIMAEFYLKMKEGEKSNDALRLAKLKYLSTTESEKLRHPFYWAPFVAYGSNNSYEFVKQEQGGHLKYGMLISVFIIFILVFLLREKALPISKEAN